MGSSPAQRLASVLLGRPLEAWVAERRDPEVRMSWELIARQLRKATDGQVDVTGQTIRAWFGHLDVEAKAS
ncbi:MAG: hypothetical protein AB7H43_15685 [Acidimicrobiia bacterium]